MAPDGVRSAESFEAECRSRGIRVTPQRLAVYSALAEDASHPTAEVVTERVRRRMPSVSPATVYRVLESLESEKMIRRVSSTGSAARFDANTLPHQHLVCRECGSITDVSIPSLGGTNVPPKAAPGFEIERLDIRLIGVCGGCASHGKKIQQGKVSRSRQSRKGRT